mgnify:CR=1 FL=1
MLIKLKFKYIKECATKRSDKSSHTVPEACGAYFFFKFLSRNAMVFSHASLVSLGA